ncbi:hypothetical protein BJV82DRAFT_219014 [Fennellomyces sp. T-0311]|nr:hypothetical protein BJV82DRAFT_219014 [Fennellomyces sp. T-0311]
MTVNPIATRCSENNQQRVKKRSVYVLDVQYHEIVIKQIQHHLDAYRMEIQSMKATGYEIIGYLRKSLPRKGEQPEDRIRLLRTMIQRLQERSNAAKVYASPSGSSNQKIIERDIPKPVQLMKELTSATGTAQDLIGYLSHTERDICLVVLDFAGLSVDPSDMCEFICKFPVIKKIVIDLIPSTGHVRVLDTAMLKSSSSELEMFCCRQSLVQRSK